MFSCFTSYCMCDIFLLFCFLVGVLVCQFCVCVRERQRQTQRDKERTSTHEQSLCQPVSWVVLKGPHETVTVRAQLFFLMKFNLFNFLFQR